VTDTAIVGGNPHSVNGCACAAFNRGAELILKTGRSLVDLMCHHSGVWSGCWVSSLRCASVRHRRVSETGLDGHDSLPYFEPKGPL
jgi:hypothetical protein